MKQSLPSTTTKLLLHVLLVGVGSAAFLFHACTAIDPSVREHANYEDGNVIMEELKLHTKPKQKQQQRNLGIEDWGEFLNYTEGLATFNENEYTYQNGTSNGSNLDLIGGSVANYRPWVVHFASKICMGSLISQDQVLTSATCLMAGGIPSFVRVGPTTQFNGVLGQVQCATLHPNYSKTNTNMEHDLAILKLTQPIDATSRQPVVLNSNANYSSSTNTQVTAYGFGFDDFTSFPNRLRQLTYNDVLDTNTCQARYPTGVINDNQHLCVQNRNRGLCSGDSGAPLVDGSGTQVGIASFTYGDCANNNYPDVYVPVAKYYTWIQQQIQTQTCNLVTPTSPPTISSQPSASPIATDAPTMSNQPTESPIATDAPTVSSMPSMVPTAQSETPTLSSMPSTSTAPSALPTLSSMPTTMSMAPTQTLNNIIDETLEQHDHDTSFQQAFTNTFHKVRGFFQGHG